MKAVEAPSAPRWRGCRLLLTGAPAVILVVCLFMDTLSLTTRSSVASANGGNNERASRGAHRLRIPKILHRVYLSGRAEFDGLLGNSNSSIRPEWAQWCEAVHDQWEHRFWDEAAAEELLQEHYPWFLPLYRRYDKVVTRGDVIRYFILHKYGGLYLDLDCECLREGVNMLQDADVVLQGTHHSEGVTNAIMASAPGHPFWDYVIRIVTDRFEDQDRPVYSTGPLVLLESLARMGIISAGEVEEMKPSKSNPLPGTHKWEGTTIQIRRMGSWYMPCWYGNGTCHRDFAIARASGLYSSELAGYHHYTGTWRIGDQSYAALVKASICENSKLVMG